MAYSSEEIVEPFWAEFSTAAKGRDPLAIQNSSVVIYSKMVVGITNVTTRIRYNGFFCWIFDTILQNIDKKNSLQEQIRYSRRAELLLAFVMTKHFNAELGVGGSLYANKNLKSNIDLSEGADWEFKEKGKNNLYWNNHGGIFGQVYAAVMRQLGLINYPNQQSNLKIFTLTEKGNELAKVFKQHILEEEIKLFWQAVSSGSIKEEELIKLKSFALNIILDSEREFYNKMLLSADNKGPYLTHHRSETIKLLLVHLSKHNKGVEKLVSSFLCANYFFHQNKSYLKKDTATAWYLFELNELIHLAYEHFHSCFLYFIKTYPTLLDYNIDELVKEAKLAFDQNDALKEVKTIEQLAHWISIYEEDIYVVCDKMEQSFSAREFGKCLMYAVKLLFYVQVNSSKHFDQLEEFAATPENNFNRFGYAVDLIHELVITQRELSIHDYMKSIIIKAINYHNFSSYRKTRIGQSLVHNYMIEDHLVWRLRKTSPNRTNPRLQNLIQYMIDIGWVKREGKVASISATGKSIFEDI